MVEPAHVKALRDYDERLQTARWIAFDDDFQTLFVAPHYEETENGRDHRASGISIWSFNKFDERPIELHISDPQIQAILAYIIEIKQPWFKRRRDALDVSRRGDESSKESLERMKNA